MSAVATVQTERTLQRMVDEREVTMKLHEDLLAEVEKSPDKTPTEAQAEQIRMYRERCEILDRQIDQTGKALEDDRKAIENAKQIRRMLAGANDSVEVTNDGVVYRDFYTYARDYVLSRELSGAARLAKQYASDGEVLAMRERLNILERTPANTLSSNVGGLTPAQHIAQIFQVIDNSRPLVASARRSTLERGQLTYPYVSQKPVVAAQGTEKTEAGNTGMVVDMETATATTYLGGGDLSWQAINWSTPDALRLWFDLAAADYALKTEQDAAQAMQHSAFTYNISSTLAALTDFSDVLTAIAAGAGDVYANSGRIADTVYLAPNAFYSLAGIAGTEAANFVAAGTLTLRTQGGTLAGLNVVVSRGMDSGVIVVGDSDGLLVAETAGAPVELRVVEPAIGGVEVGIIGAFEAVVVDPGAFAMITTAS